MIEIEKLPIIDFSNLKSEQGKIELSKEINKACKEYGFFYIKNHGIEKELINQLLDIMKRFFKLPMDVKMKWKMGLTNREYLGYFKVGQEITYGSIDWKEGFYLDVEKPTDIKHDIGIPLFPTPEQELEHNIIGFKNIIETYIKKISELAQNILESIALSLNLPIKYFYDNYMYDPFILMGLLHYPSFHNGGDSECQVDSSQSDDPSKIKFGTGPHTDQGVLTILYQDDVGGLQVKSKTNKDEYIDAPPIEDTFICNIGDMLDKMTGGYYLSNVHRVKYNTTGRDRYSIPLFFDPCLNSVPKLIECDFSKLGEKPERWDGRDIHNFSGNFGDYFLSKINRMFPDYVYKENGKL